MTGAMRTGAAPGLGAASVRARVGLVALVAVAGSLTVAVRADPALARGSSRIASRQEIVAVRQTRPVRNRPNVGAKQIAVLAAARPITGEGTVLPVIAQAIDRHGRAWLRVRLPGRVLRTAPPPSTGWIRASNTLISTTPWHIVVELSARRVLIYRAGRRLHSYPAIVGKPSTPTPTGQYFVEENVQLAANQVGAPFALATSDRSNVLQEFDGGPGQIAIHGLDNVGGQLGTAESHGCIRLADSAVAWIAARMGPGVPVTIHA